MKMILSTVAIAAILSPAMAAAQETQLEMLVELGLKRHGIIVDATELSDAQLAALHFALSNNDPDVGDLRTQNELIAILNWPPAEPSEKTE